MTDPTAGVIGLGRMGGSVAARLAGVGFDVRGYDVAADARARARDDGVEIDDHPAAVATGSDVVLTSLPSSDAVQEAYTGEDGVLEADVEGLVGLELSTIDPDTTVGVAGAAARQGLTLVDAPVSGGPEDAERGTLSVMLGGDAAAIDSPPVPAVLDAIASETVHVGDVGAGHTAKLLNNVMSMGNLLLAVEAVSLGVRRGLDGQRLWEVLSNAGGSSNQFEKRIPRVLNRNFEPGFTVAFARKDLGLALDAADEADHSMPVTALVHQLYTRAVQEGHAGADVGAVTKLFEAGDAPIEAEDPVDESFEGY